MRLSCLNDFKKCSCLLALLVLSFATPSVAQNIAPPYDTLVLTLSGDADEGNPEFLAYMDGQVLNTATAVTVAHSSGLTQQFAFEGKWGPGAHKVSIFSFGLPSKPGSQGRHIYVGDVAYNGVSITNSKELITNAYDTILIPATPGTPSDTLVLHLSEDAYRGNAEFIASIDGKSLGPAQQVSVLVNGTQSQAFAFSGNWGLGAHKVAITFINDAWGGTPETDRNLYVNAVTFDGITKTVNHMQYGNGTVSVALAAIAPSPLLACGTTPSGSTTVQQISQTPGSTTPSLTACPFGGTQATLSVVTQTYLCTNGILTAEGAPVTTTSNVGSPVCTAPLPCGEHPSGSTYSTVLSTTQGTTTPSLQACPAGGTQPITTTVTQTYSCLNGTQTAQGAPLSTTVANGLPTCTQAVISGACGSASTNDAPYSGKTPFPLGVYVGQPNIDDSTQQASFVSLLSHFTTVMNIGPTFLDTYVNAGDPISHWTAQNGWQAASWANTPQIKNMTPVIGLPLTSTQDDFDKDYLAFASGTYDADLANMVQTWAQHGVLTQYWRLGWEMNLNSNPGYGGNMGSQEQKDWIAAFQHVYTVLHAAAKTYGAEVQIIWNPGVTSYGSAGNAITYFYPGSDYVDIIGVDVYADSWQFSLYDFTTGKTDATFAEWESNPANLIHYYTYPAATQWSNDGSGGHSTTLAQLITLAQTDHKPLAIVETGAGNNKGGHDIADNAVFVNWLSQTLHQAEPAVTIAFVTIWDSNGGGDYEFSLPTDNKPMEATAWSQDFGNQIVPPVTGLCSTGTPSSSTELNARASWTCQGSNGGTSTSCMTPVPFLAY